MRLKLWSFMMGVGVAGLVAGGWLAWTATGAMDQCVDLRTQTTASGTGNPEALSRLCGDLAQARIAGAAAMGASGLALLGALARWAFVDGRRPEADTAL